VSGSINFAILLVTPIWQVVCSVIDPFLSCSSDRRRSASPLQSILPFTKPYKWVSFVYGADILPLPGRVERLPLINGKKSHIKRGIEQLCSVFIHMNCHLPLDRSAQAFVVGDCAPSSEIAMAIGSLWWGLLFNVLCKQRSHFRFIQRLVSFSYACSIAAGRQAYLSLIWRWVKNQSLSIWGESLKRKSYNLLESRSNFKCLFVLVFMKSYLSGKRMYPPPPLLSKWECIEKIGGLGSVVHSFGIFFFRRLCYKFLGETDVNRTGSRSFTRSQFCKLRELWNGISRGSQ
jgi:hypothetical protein